MGSCGSVLQPDTQMKDVNPQSVEGKDREGTDMEIAAMMAKAEDGSNFKVKVEVIEGGRTKENIINFF